MHVEETTQINLDVTSHSCPTDHGAFAQPYLNYFILQ